MTPEQLRAKFPNASEDFLRRNSSMLVDIRDYDEPLDTPILTPLRAAKRLRQRAKPLLNKLEREYFGRLVLLYPKAKIRPQAKAYRVANGVVYWADFTAVIGGREYAWEVKGPRAWEDAIVKLKTAAHEWPEVCFTLAWKDKRGDWREQEVLP